MKKGLIKKIGIGLLAGALTFLPAKKAFSLDDVVTGNIIETFSEAPVKSGVEIKAWEYLGDRIGDFVGEGVTDSNGNFSLNLNNNSSNYLKLEISKSDSSCYQAERFVNLEDSVLLDIVNRHDVEVYDLDGNRTNIDFMKMFDMWARFEIPCTHRWTESPKVFIKTLDAPQEHINMAKNVIQNIWPQFTKIVRNGNFISAPYIEEGTVTPDYAKYGSNGWIESRWKTGVDAGVHSEKLDGNRIYSGIVRFNPTIADKGTYLEELIQVLGLTSGGETHGFYGLDGEMLPVGFGMGKVLYSRPIGNRTPDINPEPQVDIIRYIRPVTNLTVEDVPDDNGNQLELKFTPSISEGKNLVSKYRIYRSVDTNFNNAALIDSVNVGSTSFVDRNVPLNNIPYYYWVETVGNVPNCATEKTNNSGETRFIEPPVNFRVSDVPNDNGHQLKLNWEKSPSEDQGLVNWYRFFRSRNSNGIERVRNLSDFLSMSANSRLDSLNAWDGKFAVLVDSVSAGNREYIDFVPKNNTPYYYWMQSVGNNIGSAKIAGRWNDNNIGVKEENREFNVSNPYPNPSNSSITLNYTIPRGTNIELVVYDINGRKVKTLDCGWRDEGSYRSSWDGKDTKGRDVGNGVYLIQLNAGKYNKTEKLMLVK